MKRWLLLLSVMLRAPRPERIAGMNAIAMPNVLGSGYEAMTFFGTVFTQSKKDAEAYNSTPGPLRNHETIHLYQARSTHNSWICFYWLYGYYWLKALPFRKRLSNAGYWLNPFELEAYLHMNDLHYLDGKSCTDGWRQYSRMALEERLRLFSRLK